MADSIVLNVGGREIKNFLAYEVDADMYAAAAAFNVALANPEITVHAGQGCKLYVNGHPALNGYVDKVSRSTSKDGSSLKLEGRDMMGLLVDWYLTDFKDVKETSIKTLAESLLSSVPVIDLKKIRYEQGVFPAPKQTHRFEMGQTIFDALRTVSAKHGLLFYCNPEGNFVFGTPKAAGAAKFNIVSRKDGRGNNAQKGVLTIDVSKLYASVTVNNPAFLGAGNVLHDPSGATFTYDGFPKDVIKKPFMLMDDSVPELMPARVNQIFAEMRHQAFRAEYMVSGYSQNHAGNTRLWTINELCRVDDEVNNLHGNYLVTGRTFSLSREHGRVTKVRLGLPGVKVA